MCSISQLAGIEPVEVKKPARRKRSAASRWGTPEEKYRRLCMLALLCRYAYYHHATSLVEDQLYDQLERLILNIENIHRELIHPRSPTVKTASNLKEDYPRSVRDFYERHADDPKTFGPIGKAIGWFMRDAMKEFGV